MKQTKFRKYSTARKDIITLTGLLVVIASIAVLAAMQLPSLANAVTNGTSADTTPEDAAATAVPDAHLDYAPGTAPKFWSVAAAETVMARWPDYSKAYFNSWTYVNGYELYGFDMLYRATGDKKYLEYTKRYIDQFVDDQGEFRSVTNAKGEVFTPAFYNLDNMMTGNTLVMLYEYTKDVRYRKAAEKIRRALDNYPRNHDGGFWHSRSLSGEMWIDGIFMGQMFLTRYGKSIGDSQYCWDEATKQICVYAKRAQRDDSGLYVHGIFESGHGEKAPPTWADPQTGLSREVWSEGLGWYALVTVETLADLPKDHPRRAEVEDIFRRLAAGLKRTQDPKIGRWFQVVDKGDQPGNWTDTSGSAMFTYAIAKGIELGLLDKYEYAPVVEKGYQGIIGNARINSKGLLDIYSACDGVGVQDSYDRYIKFKRSINAKEAVAGFLWATAMVEKPQLEHLKKPPIPHLVNPGATAKPVQTGQGHSFVGTDYTQGKVFIVSAEGKVEWEYAGATNCNDVWVLPNGNLLFNTGHGVKEVTRGKKVVFDYESQSEIYACQRLTNGNTFIGECNAGRLLEVDPDGKIVKEIHLLPQGKDGGHAFMRNARRLDNGNYLVALFGQNVVREYDPLGKVVREIPAPGGPHSVVRLPNGNTLISCGDGEGGSRVFEVNADGKTVWQVQGNELAGVSLKFMAGLERLPNGDTLMANWLGHANQFGSAPDLIEVTPDKRVVWTFSGGHEIKTISSALILDASDVHADTTVALH